METVNIWTVFVGDKYPIIALESIRTMVEKNIDVEKYKLQFHVITDNYMYESEEEKRSSNRFNIIGEMYAYPGWWSKMYIFDKAKKGINLYFDLDTIITGDLTPLIEYAKTSFLAMPKNWARSGHGGFQSSVMAWSGEAEEIFEGFEPSRIGPFQRGNHGLYEFGDVHLWGDQEYLTQCHSAQINPIREGLICSYKYHARQGLPEQAIVVCFHGKPDYWEVNEPWIKEALQ